MLHLDRPLVVFDLEATAVDPEEARIIQVALFRLEPSPNGPATTDRLIACVNPGVPIPQDVTDLTGIGEADVANAPTFDALRPDLDALIRDADLAGFNVLAYDLPLLKAAYERVGAPLPGPSDRQVLDVYKLEQVLVPRTLSALFETYTGSELEDAHDAAADVRATIDVLDAQLRTHEPDAQTPAALADLIRGDYLDDNRKLKRVETPEGGTGVEVCFGKHMGKTVRQIQDEDPGYLAWMRDAITDLKPHIDAALAGTVEPLTKKADPSDTADADNTSDTKNEGSPSSPKPRPQSEGQQGVLEF